MTKETFFKVFDAKIQSILLYSSEVWGDNRLESIERVHLYACKRFLNVPIKTPNVMIYGELGRYPLYINSYIRCIKYWLKILHLDHKRLPWQAYQMLLKLDEMDKRCWVSNVRNILSQSGFHVVWLSQGVGNVNIFVRTLKERLIDMYRQEWDGVIRDKERYRLFSLFKNSIDYERYISFIDVYCFRVAFTQARLNALPINANLHRFSEKPEDKFCPFCKNVIEDETHIVFRCPLYCDLRKKYINTLDKRPIFVLLKGVNYDVTNCVAKFVFHALDRRRHFHNL
jgi:hypothetical protein